MGLFDAVEGDHAFDAEVLHAHRALVLTLVYLFLAGGALFRFDFLHEGHTGFGHLLLNIVPSYNRFERLTRN